MSEQIDSMEVISEDKENINDFENVDMVDTDSSETKKRKNDEKDLKIPKPKTPFFAFLSENRERIKDELFSNGAKQQVTLITKRAGELWKDIPDNEKEQRQAEYKSKLAEWQKSQSESDKSTEGEPAKKKRKLNPAELPLTHVELPIKRIKDAIKRDEDVNQISAEATALITKATELFIAYLAKESSKLIPNGKKNLVHQHIYDRINQQKNLKFLTVSMIPPKQEEQKDFPKKKILQTKSQPKIASFFGSK